MAQRVNTFSKSLIIIPKLSSREARLGSRLIYMLQQCMQECLGIGVDGRVDNGRRDYENEACLGRVELCEHCDWGYEQVILLCPVVWVVHCTTLVVGGTIDNHIQQNSEGLRSLGNGLNSHLVHAFLLNLLRWHWLVTLYRFQVYNSIMHLYIALCIHHPKSSLLLSLFIPLLSSTSPHYPPTLPSGHYHTVVCAWGLCLHALWIIPLLSFIQSPPPLWELSVCFMCPYLCFYFVQQFILFTRFHI